MSLPKITGIETEYGVLIRGAGESDPFLASRLLLQHCEEAGEMHLGAHHASNSRETLPSPDANLREPSRHYAGAEQTEYGYVPYNLMLPNGARFYIDHAHPEYSTAEAIAPREVVAADKAGELILERCCRRVNASGILPQGQKIVVYKNNSDYQGNSYGCHENYLLSASTFEDLLERKLHRTLMVLVPFLVTRTILCGAGKVGAENCTPPTGFQLSQRADFFETVIGPQTTHHRPLINTRDEPHADLRRFRRLHIIIGDANMAEYSTYLKVGTAQLVLMMLEDDYIHLNLTLEDPVVAFQIVSRDLSLRQKLTLEQGDALSALEIQREYLRLAHRYLSERSGPDWLYEVVQVWENTLDAMEEDWHRLSTRLDWAIKRNLLERYLEGQNCDWETVGKWQPLIEMTLALDRRIVGDDPFNLLEAVRSQYPDLSHRLERYAREEGLNWADYWRQREIYFTLRRLDLEYHNICQGLDQQDAGLFYRLQQRGLVDRLLTDDAIIRLVNAPPEDTRAYLRGYCVAHYADRIRYVDWGEISFYDPGGQLEYHLVLPDPAAGSKANVGPLLEGTPNLSALLGQLCKNRELP